MFAHLAMIIIANCIVEGSCRIMICEVGMVLGFRFVFQMYCVSGVWSWFTV